MFKSFFCLISAVLFLLELSFSQSKISGICIDKNSKQVVPYATVHLLKSNLWTDADQNGFFEFPLADNDTILITSIGYSPLQFLVYSNSKVDSFKLEPLVVSLPGIFIGEKKLINIGKINAKKKFDMNSKSCSRFEIATKITVPENISEYQIKNIYINGEGFNSENPVRIHIYSVGKLGEPNKELLKKDIIVVQNADIKKYLVINVEDQGIIISEKQFFISVQWIADSLNQNRINPRKRSIVKPGIFCTYSNANSTSFIRDLSNKRFGYKWLLITKEILYPYDYKIPEKITSAPLNMLVSCDLLY